MNCLKIKKSSAYCDKTPKLGNVCYIYKVMTSENGSKIEVALAKKV